MSAENDLVSSLLARIQELENAVTAIGYDAKAAKRKRFPVMRQDRVLSSITRALCIETIDPWKENRVRFYHPLLHSPKSNLFSLPFASPISPFGGFDDSGVNWPPPAGSTIMVLFEGGERRSPFYLGTTWHRDRGPGGSQINSVFTSREWNSIYSNSRAGNFLCGPDDGSQCLPPWNTESYNSDDTNQVIKFYTDPTQQQKSTYPNIYGFKTPEKHMLKMVDGDAKCNRRWKRLELMSGGGSGWLIFKDDHLHYGGQWSHPKCGPRGSGDVGQCSTSDGDLPYFSDFQGKPIEGASKCEPQCEGDGKKQCSKILGGHSSTPTDPPTKYGDSNQGANNFFKQKNECWPYRGPGTPQNNRCDLPQGGVQMLSGSGHTFLFDDSVEEPRGIPNWQRSLQPFDFGCNNKYLGRTYWCSATGHEIMLSDVEEDTALRGENNFIRIRSASGSFIEINDHTIGKPDTDCPPNYAGEKRGISMMSTSRHRFRMIDHMNLQCSPKRQSGGIPVSKATEAFIEIVSGYGLEMRFQDDNSQQETQQQYIQILHPQCVNPATDDKCNSCDGAECRGPHFLRFQGRPKGTPGIVFLRAGGHAIRQTYDMDIVLVGDKEKNPSDKFTYVTKKHIRISEDTDFRYTGDKHIFFAEEQILLMAGRDCPPQSGKKCKSPCMYNVIVARCPVFCPMTNILHWTEKAMSERVFASGHHPCQDPPNCGSGCDSYNSEMAAAQGKPCSENSNPQSIDTGNGTVTVDTSAG